MFGLYIQKCLDYIYKNVWTIITKMFGLYIYKNGWTIYTKMARFRLEAVCTERRAIARFVIQKLFKNIYF